MGPWYVGRSLDIEISLQATIKVALSIYKIAYSLISKLETLMPLSDYYPDLICNLPKFSGRFDARKLSAENCDVLFATYPAGTVIEPHKHDTDNVGVITKGELLLTMDGATTTITTASGTKFQLTKNTAPSFVKIPARLNSGSQIISLLF